MSVNIGAEKSKLTIYKDEQGRYKIYIKGRELQEDGTEKDIFMSKTIQFKKDVLLKNRTVIEVLNGWNSCYRIKTNELNEKGEDGYCKPKREKQKDDFSFEYNGDDLPF